MIDLLGGFKSIVARKKTAIIDNAVFRLHYKITSYILVAFCIFVSAFQYLGDPIDCFNRDEKNDKLAAVADKYCWIQSTFTLTGELTKPVGSWVASPGIAQDKAGSEKAYHSYYQWVGFVLLIQTILFYTPHYLWKVWEGGRMEALVMELRCLSLDQEVKLKSTDLLVTYLIRNFNHHQWYLVKFVLCEILNLINVICQIWLTDSFLGGEFSTYGYDVVRFVTMMDQQDRVDPMVKIFPKLTKCPFYYFGPSGTVQKKDFLCILPLNIFNEKIYVFLWFWFLVLAIISGLQFLYRLLVLASSRMRYFSLMSRAIETTDVDAVMSHAHAGDWFVLQLLSKNIDWVSFNDVITTLGRRLESNPKRKRTTSMISCNKRIIV